MSKVDYSIVNSRFGLLTVTARSKNTRAGKAAWLCTCDCGKQSVVTTDSLRSGNTRSCGCLRHIVSADVNTTHGMTNTLLYGIWTAMLSRCLNPKNKRYANYGGRGIRVCDRWRENFQNFASDMGPRPSLAHSLDRYPDNDGNYEPGNCRWATAKEQGNNRRNSRFYEFQGKRLTLAQIATFIGVQYRTLWNRLYVLNMPFDKATAIAKLDSLNSAGR